MDNKLLAIQQYGQKIWLDNLSRELLNSGTLTQLIHQDGIAGVTSNPSIFYKALTTDSNYAEQISQIKQRDLSTESRYEALVIPDIIAACDILLPLYVSSNYTDGYVSFEVSPALAHDTQATVEHAKRLWQHINRPNLMIKIPATPSGIAALTSLTAMGINVNVTLLFSNTQVINTWNAYIEGLNIRLNHGLSITSIKAVASLFISRIDSAVDSLLPNHLQGKTAINLAKKTYLDYQKIFHGNKFKQLRDAGAHPQYLLFASTGSKNPQYSDVLYVESLIGSETINTVPDATLTAFRDHGVAGNNLMNNINNSLAVIDEVSKFIDLEQLGNKLQQDGLDLFAKSFADLLELLK